MTTIQVSDKVREMLQQRKLYKAETYEEVILNLIEDSLELSEESKRNISEAQKDIEKGKLKSLSEFEKELNF